MDQAIEVLRDGSAGLLVELKAPWLYPGIVADVVATLRQVPFETARIHGDG